MQHSGDPRCALTKWDGPPSPSMTKRSPAEKEFSQPVNPAGSTKLLSLRFWHAKQAYCLTAIKMQWRAAFDGKALSRPKGIGDRKKLFFPEAPHNATGPSSPLRQKKRAIARNDLSTLPDEQNSICARNDLSGSPTNSIPFVLDLLVELCCHHHRNEHHKEASVRQKNLDDPTCNLIWEQSKILTSASMQVTLPKPIAIAMALSEVAITPWGH